MIVGVGDVVHGLDVTGLEVRGTVTAVHDVGATGGPFTSTVAVVAVHGTPTPLVALVRTYDIKHRERGST